MEEELVRVRVRVMVEIGLQYFRFILFEIGLFVVQQFVVVILLRLGQVALLISLV